MSQHVLPLISEHRQPEIPRYLREVIREEEQTNKQANGKGERQTQHRSAYPGGNQYYRNIL
jgi:hypothetical protein